MSRKCLEITVQDESLSEVRRKLGDMEKKAGSVQANSLNQTLTVIKKYIPKQVQKDYTYKRKLQKPRAHRASSKKLTAALYYDRKNAGLFHFDISKGTQGTPVFTPGKKLAVKVQSGGRFKSIARAYEHEGNIFRRESSLRLPITRLLGPSEHSMVRSVGGKVSTRAFTAKTLSEKLDAQINNQYLKKWGLK